MNPANTDLERRAKAGDMAAQLALGAAAETAQNSRLARGWFATAAKAGSVEALRRLGINLLTCEPIVGQDGVTMIRNAAEAGDADAAHVCAMIAAQDKNLANRFEIAQANAVEAAARGHETAQGALAALAGENAAAPGDAKVWQALASKIDWQAHCAPLPVHEISQSPRIAVIENCLSPALCNWLIGRAKPLAARAQVYDPQTGLGRVESARSNASVQFDIAQSDLVLMCVRARIAAIAGLALDALETTSILHYQVGQQFAPHYDFLDKSVPGYARDLAARGQRVATFLLYLSDDYAGGETAFPKLGLRHHGKKGDALLFWNVDTQGAPDPQTFHAGLPPTQGEKWVLSQWLRDARLKG